MIAEVLAVGTELLMGQIANTNAQYISNRLPEAGIGVYYHSVVGDNPARLKECLTIALGRSDVVIMTGGLGPTQDDLTKETVAGIFGKKLVLHQPSLDKLTNFFAKHNRTMTENNVKQAYFPENCIIIENHNGTAPGCLIEASGKVVILLPGPPSEMKPMFEEFVMPFFKDQLDYKIVSKYLRIFGIGESAMETQILDLIGKQTNPTIAPYAKEGEVTVRVTARCAKHETGDKLINPVVEEIIRRLGDTVYSTENKNLDEVTGELLMKHQITLSLAESCTGGLVAAKLTAIPGISSVFNRGFVTYSNEAKMEHLGVRAETLQQHGAVSSETAEEMAAGARRVSETDIGVSITGIAGPGGGTEEKPVGTVFIALADGKGVQSKHLQLWGSRDRIRSVTALHVFDMIRRWIIAGEYL